MQAAAAAIGVPLGHDFCAISLSDILKPWSIIEQKITTAAQGDFVIAFYNPVSREVITIIRDFLMPPCLAAAQDKAFNQLWIRAKHLQASDINFWRRV